MWVFGFDFIMEIYCIQDRRKTYEFKVIIAVQTTVLHFYQVLGVRNNTAI